MGYLDVEGEALDLLAAAVGLKRRNYPGGGFEADEWLRTRIRTKTAAQPPSIDPDDLPQDAAPLGNVVSHARRDEANMRVIGGTSMGYLDVKGEALDLLAAAVGLKRRNYPGGGFEADEWLRTRIRTKTAAQPPSIDPDDLPQDAAPLGNVP